MAQLHLVAEPAITAQRPRSPLPNRSRVWHNWGKMTRARRTPRPLDRARLDELALAYAARFATTRAKLEAYLRRKLREFGWAGEGDPGIEALAARMVAAGYVDDAAYARAKSGSLLRRGYGARRVSQALQAAGVEEAVREDVRAGEAAQRKAALALVTKRRFGPFGAERLDPVRREKQIAAMLRAGHPLDTARELIDAGSRETAEDWAEQACDDADGDDACD